jgi:hypothetical protein
LNNRRGIGSFPRNNLLRALLLQVVHAIRGGRQLMEHVDFNAAQEVSSEKPALHKNLTKCAF